MNTIRRLLFYALLATLTVWLTTEYVLVEYTCSTFAFTIGCGDIWFLYDSNFAITLALMGNGPGFTFRYIHPWVWFPLPEIDDNGINIPFWLVLALLLPPWLLLNWAHRKRRRRELAGGCKGCGYDLTGNESGRCPECNAEVATT